MITLYTTHCTKCDVLHKKLVAKNIDFNEIDDKQTVTKFGISHSMLTSPLLDVDGNVMGFVDAVKWVNSR